MRRSGRFYGLWFPKRNRLLELHERGLSVPKIADELKVSPSMVQTVLQAAEVQKVLKMARGVALKGVR
jgi:predicted transcriptional regulator